jgi:hypothetical protein
MATPWRQKPSNPRSAEEGEGDLVKKTVSAVTQVIGAAALLFFGYTVLASLPDLRRYIKISTM